MRRAAKRDLTEPAILEAWRAVGADYILLDPFDALVLFRGRLFMVDCKTGRGKPTTRQADLVKRGWPLQFANTPDQALTAIGAVR